MKKKGFTLIELLAVIVILAIIALIATPLVLKYIETSRIESFKVSIENIKDSALKYAASEQLNGKVTYPVAIDVQDLDFKGKEDYIGKVIVRKDGTIKEYIQKDDYRSSNGSLVNGKSNPYLKVKEGKTAVIDEEKGFVYSFYTNGANYINKTLSLEVLEGIFEGVNCNLEFVKNDKSSYATGAKILLKDSNGIILKEYQIVIFTEISGEGRLSGADLTLIVSHLDGNSLLTGAYLEAADINRDGVVDVKDKELLILIVESKFYNQFTYKLEER